MGSSPVKKENTNVSGIKKRHSVPLEYYDINFKISKWDIYRMKEFDSGF